MQQFEQGEGQAIGARQRFGFAPMLTPPRSCHFRNRCSSLWRTGCRSLVAVASDVRRTSTAVGCPMSIATQLWGIRTETQAQVQDAQANISPRHPSAIQWSNLRHFEACGEVSALVSDHTAEQHCGQDHIPGSARSRTNNLRLKMQLGVCGRALTARAIRICHTASVSEGFRCAGSVADPAPPTAHFAIVTTSTDRGYVLA